MALASQTARNHSIGRVTSRRGGSWRSRRNSRMRRRLMVVGGVIGMFALGWWWLGGGPEPATAGEDERLAAHDPTEEVLPTAASTNAREYGLSSALESAQRNRKPENPVDQKPLTMLTMGEAPAQTQTTPTSSAPDPKPIEPAPPARGAGTGATKSLFTDAENALAANEPLVARLLLNRILQDPRTSQADQRGARARLQSINEELVFSPRIVDGDPLVERYVIKPGDSLSKIATAQQLNVDWRFIQRINRISDPRRIRVGQTIKLVRGPFEAVIDKSDFRLDLYAVVGSEGSAESRLFIRSFNVGLGKHDATPVGSWIVRKNSKLINPHWVNPQTGESYSPDNPANPIGEHWIGLEGTDENTMALQGYGIHGTIEPNSIGKEASMGCVRLLADDVALLYELLVEDVTRVSIQP